MNVAQSKDEWLAARNDLVPKGRDERELSMTWLRRRRKPLGVAAAGALLAVLVPKCPMCLAMYLSFLGAAASWFVWLRPLGVVLTAAGLAVAAWRYLGRRNPLEKRIDTRTT